MNMIHAELEAWTFILLYLGNSSKGYLIALTLLE